MIKELDVVTLTHDLQEHGLTKGSKGAVVHCYGNKQGFEVEFVSEEVCVSMSCGRVFLHCE